MLRQTTATEERMMREFLVAVLLEAPRSEIEPLYVSFGTAMAEIAVTSCGIGLADLDSGKFATAAEIYGEALGEKVMVDSMSRLGL